MKDTTNEEATPKYRLLFSFVFVVVLMVVTLFSLRHAIQAQGIIGHTWDWFSPVYPEQLRRFGTFVVYYVWDNVVSLGVPNITPKMGFAFGVLTWILSPVGGEWFQRILLLALIPFLGFATLLLARSVGVKETAAWAASSFLSLSPLTYSRVIAGHLGYLFAFGFFILFVWAFLRFLESPAKGASRARWILFLAVLSIPLGVHPSFVILMVLCVAWGCILYGLWFRSLTPLLWGIVVGFSIILANMFWIINFLEPLFTQTDISRGWGLSAQLGTVEADVETLLRDDYLASTSQPLFMALRGWARTRMDSEFVFPMTDPGYVLGYLASWALALAAFAVLWPAIVKTRRIWFFVGLGLMGAFLSSGVTTVPGELFFSGVVRRSSILYASFSNANRFSPLWYLAASVLVGWVATSLPTESRSRKSAVFGGIVIGVILISYPFWSGKITVPLRDADQPLNVKVTPVNPEDRRVFDLLAAEKSDVRVAYLPPAFNSFVGDTDTNYEWSTFFSPLPEFASGMNPREPIGKYLQSLIIYDDPLYPVRDLGRIFGMASAKYLVLPKYEKVEAYATFRGIKNVQPRYEEMLRKQRDIVPHPLTDELRSAVIYENRLLVPRIFASDRARIVAGDLEDLRRADLDATEDKPLVNIFLGNSGSGGKDLIESFRMIDTEWVASDPLHLAYLLVPDRYRRGLAREAVEQRRQGWQPLGTVWSMRPSYAALPDKGSGVYVNTGSRGAILKTHFSVEERDAGPHLIVAPMHHHPSGGWMTFRLDQEEVRRLSTRWRWDSGLTTRVIGHVDLTPGAHHLEIEVAPGTEGALHSIAVVPLPVWEEAKRQYESIVREHGTTFYWRAPAIQKGDPLTWSVAEPLLQPLSISTVYAERSSLPFRPWRSLGVQFRSPMVGSIPDRAKREDFRQWSYLPNNAKFAREDLPDGSVNLDVAFDGNSFEDEYVSITKTFDAPLDLQTNRHVYLSYAVEDPSIQVFEIVFGVKRGPESRRIEHLTSIQAHANRSYRVANTTVFDAYEIVMRIARSRKLKIKTPWIDSVTINAHKIWNADCSIPGRRGTYRFRLLDFGIGNTRPVGALDYALTSHELLKSPQGIYYWGEGAWRQVESLNEVPENTSRAFALRFEAGMDPRHWPEIPVVYDYSSSKGFGPQNPFLDAVVEGPAGALAAPQTLERRAASFMGAVHIPLKGDSRALGRHRVRQLRGMNTVLHLAEMTVEAFERDSDGLGDLPAKTTDRRRDIKAHLERQGLENLALLRVLLPSRAKNLLSQQSRVTWEKIDPTRYNVLVESADRPFILVFGETFDKGWKARVVETPGLNSDVTDPPHFTVNGFGNGWVVMVPEGRGGTRRMELEYAPQRIYRIGLGVSGFFLAAILTGAGGLWIRGRLKKPS